MNKKVFALAMMPVLGVAGLTGCGGGGDSDNIISIAIVSDSAEYTTMMRFIEGYRAIPGNENKEFKVVKMTKYDDYVFDSVLYDDLADIIQVFDYSAEYFSNADLDGLGNSLLLPLSSYMEKDGLKEDDFFESIIEMTKCGPDNQVYWMPRDYNKVVCAYNKDMFDLAGVDYPSEDWTWEDMVDICEELQAHSDVIKNDYSHSGTFYPIDLNPNFGAVYYPLLKSFGSTIIDNATKTVFGNSSEAVNKAYSTLTKIFELEDNRLAAPVSNAIPFTNKQCAMMFMVRPNLPTYVKGLGQTAIDFVSIPTYSDNGSNNSFIGMGCSGYGITTSCSDSKKSAAWDFLRYIVSEDGQNIFSQAGSGIPSLKKLALDSDAEFRKYLVTDEYQPNHEAFVAHDERDIPMNYMKGFEVDKQQQIYQFISARMLSAFIKASDRQKYILEFKEQLEDIWK